MRHGTVGAPKWIGALGPDDRAKGDLAAALAELTGDASSYYVSVTTRDIDQRVAEGAKSCKLDAGLLAVTASDGLSSEHAALLAVLGDYDVPAIVVITKTDCVAEDELKELKKRVQRVTKEHLGYAAPVHMVPTLDADLSAEKLKGLSEEAQVLANKRRKRRRKPGETPKEYPFVIGQEDLERLMRQNVRAALEEHRDRDETVAVWRDGGVVRLTGAEIDFDAVPPLAGG